MIVRQMDPDRFGWIAERARLVIGPGFRAIEAVDGDRTVGAVAFDGWTPNSVSMHIALDSPIALRGLVRKGFGIAFRQCKKEIATCLVLSSNVRSRRLVEHLGFREVFRGRNYWTKGVDMLLYEMRADECRYLDRNATPIAIDSRSRKVA